MKHKYLIFAVLALIILTASVIFLLSRDPHKKDLILYLPFNEGKGITVNAYALIENK